MCCTSECPCVKLLFLPVSHFSLPYPPVCLLDVKGVISEALVALAADTLTGGVLGGLHSDGHHVGGRREVRVVSPWYLPLWHDVVDGCEGRKGRKEVRERMSYMQRPINPVNTGTYCDKDTTAWQRKNWMATVLSRLLAGVRDSFLPELAWLCHVLVPGLLTGFPRNNKTASSCYIFGPQSLQRVVSSQLILS